MANTKYTVIGAGCGGHAIAGYLATKGLDVSLYNRSIDRLNKTASTGYIELGGKLEGRGNLSYIGTNISEAVRDSDVIMVATTATGHKDIAINLAPHLREGQIILLNPGRTCGALEVDYTLRQYGCSANVIVAEANTLIYAVRVNKEGIAMIKGIKNEVPISALYSEDTQKVIDTINREYPEFVAASSFLETSFSNIGAIFHPTITLLNRDKILKQDIFDFYTDGVTEEVADFMEKVDIEIRTIANALGTQGLSVIDWLGSRYGLKISDIYQMIRSNPAYQGIKAPTTLHHRYIWEDIPTGLVPISSFGDALGILTPHIDYLINEGCNVLNMDLRESGRTIEKLGLSKENLNIELEEIVKGKFLKAA